MIERFTNRTDFESYADFASGFRLVIPENFNFAYDVVDAWAAEEPDREALLWTNPAGEERRFTFADMKELSDKTAAFFQSLGVGKGTRVMLMLKRHWEFWPSMMALHKLGAVAIPATHLLTAEDIEYRCRMADIKVIVAAGDEDMVNHINEAKPHCKSVEWLISTGPCVPEGWLDFGKGIENAPEFKRPAHINDNSDVMLLYFTSGTSGTSKGVMLSERNMCASLHTYSEVAENWIINRLPAGQKLPLSHMTLLPLFHMACFVCVMSYPPAGWALNLCGDIRDFYRDLGLMHSDVMASAPMLVETIYNDMKRGRVSRLNGLWDLCCSSAALDPKMLLELAQNGFVVNQCYGMTETFGDGILNFTQVEKHMSAVGKPDDHVQYKLDETGEICIKGDCVMLGYYKDPEATAEVIDADGWFHTGDLARMDEEGFYYITGRKKNLIILDSGENVSPEELEKLLGKCADIKECIVKEMGKKIGAVICCEPEKEQTVRTFVTELNRTLPLYKRISAVECTAEPLPRNALGKLLRR